MVKYDFFSPDEYKLIRPHLKTQVYLKTWGEGKENSHF